MLDDFGGAPIIARWLPPAAGITQFVNLRQHEFAGPAYVRDQFMNALLTGNRFHFYNDTMRPRAIEPPSSRHPRCWKPVQPKIRMSDRERPCQFADRLLGREHKRLAARDRRNFRHATVRPVPAAGLTFY